MNGPNNTAIDGTFTLVIGGQPRRKTIAPETVTVRRMTLAEILSLSGHAEFIANDGTLRTVKINGAVRTWKRDAGRIEVPIKYGLYEYAVFNKEEALRRFVVRVS